MALEWPRVEDGFGGENKLLNRRDWNQLQQEVIALGNKIEVRIPVK